MILMEMSAHWIVVVLPVLDALEERCPAGVEGMEAECYPQSRPHGRRIDAFDQLCKLLNHKTL